MSKSKKNTVDPRHIIETYGADAARLFMLSDSPPERDLEWTDAGIEGAWRYINRLWKLVLENKEVASGRWRVADDDQAALGLRKATHKTIAAVTDDIECFHFNKAIARIRELSNLLESQAPQTDAHKAAYGEALNTIVLLITPFLPHLGEELWLQLGHKTSAAPRAWPKADPALLVDDEVTVAIQVNGKLRATIQMPRDLDRTLAEAKVLELQAIKDALKDKQVAKVIVVPNRIVNVVAKNL